jgi:hypothetical protein
MAGNSVIFGNFLKVTNSNPLNIRDFEFLVIFMVTFTGQGIVSVTAVHHTPLRVCVQKLPNDAAITERIYRGAKFGFSGVDFLEVCL